MSASTSTGGEARGAVSMNGNNQISSAGQTSRAYS
jgi:hypothetical protein